MRSLVLVFIGGVISFYWLRPVESHVRTHRTVNSTLGRATQGKLIDLSQFVQPKAGQLPLDMLELFHVAFPPGQGNSYYEPDSANTKIEWLSWPGEEEMVLIQTGAGYGTGSCGWTIVAGLYNGYDGTFTKLLDECGVVDTIFSIKHNGVNDFSTSNK